MPYPKKRKRLDEATEVAAPSKRSKEDKMLKGAFKQVAVGARTFASAGLSQAAKVSRNGTKSQSYDPEVIRWKKLPVTPLPPKAGGRFAARNNVRGGDRQGRHAGRGAKPAYQSNAAAKGRKGSSFTGPFHTEEYIFNNHELPRAADYNLAREPIDHASELIDSANLTVLRKETQLANRLECTWQAKLSIELDQGLLIECLGHGRSQTHARQNANLHAIALLHGRGLLKSILPGGEHASISKEEIRQDKDARLDVINFAARNDALPVFTTRTRRSVLKRGQLFWCKVEITELNLTGYGTATAPRAAQTAACVALKNAAEQLHEQTGDGTLLVKDYTKLNMASAKAFVDYHCFINRTRYELDLQVHKKTSTWHGTLKIHGQAPTETVADTTEKPSERTFTSVLEGDTKKDAEDLAYVGAALSLKRESPDIWKKFVREMKRGNGEVLKHLKPIDVDVDFDAISAMRSAIREITQIEQHTRGPSESQDASSQVQVRKRQYRQKASLSSQDHETKSAALLHQLNQYQEDPALAILREKRNALPMVQYRDDVMRLVLDNDISVVVGATGSGKTTQLPQLILEHEIMQGKGSACNIICTQPRRIAAVSVAQRVCVERNEALQESIGYQVRFDAKLPQYGGSITYCTTGILLRQLQDNQDDTLDNVSHIIVDEVHERDIQIDFLLVILKQLLNDRRKAGKPPVKLILMSATIDTTLFCKYFGENFESGRCPYIEVPGRTFPVTQHSLEETVSLLKSYDRKQVAELYSRDTSQYLRREIEGAPQPSASAPVSARNSDDGDDRAVINWKSQGIVGEDGELDVAMDKEDTVTPVGLMSLTIAHLLKTTTEGSILVFLPGLAEITALNKLLTTTKPLDVDMTDPRYKIYMLHSAIPQMQQEVFETLEAGHRKIILSTNIAETSITIPDVVYVVDSGKHRETQYDQAKRISALISTWISKSNARQRAGRAGRVQHGHYYSMLSIQRQESLEVAPQPEILRTDLQELCLQIKAMGVADILTFLKQAIEPPSQLAVEASIDHLQSLSALDESEELTPLGRVLSLLPVQPSLGKMVLLGTIFKCVDPALIIAAAASVKDPFLSPLERRAEADACKRNFAAGTGSDVLAVVHAFQQWRTILSEQGMSAARDFCFANFLHQGSMMQLAKTCEQTLETVSKTGLLAPFRKQRHIKLYGTAQENVNASSLALQAALATAGFYPNLAVQTTLPRLLRTAFDNAAMIHPNSLAAPKTVDGRSWGRLAPDAVMPYGTLYVYAQKTQADGHQVSLRGCTRTSPLSVIFFGGQARSDGSIIKVDDWVPFFARGPQHFVTMEMSKMLDTYLERTFGNLGEDSMAHMLGRNEESRRGKASEQTFLDQDPVREPVVKGVVEALEQVYKGITRTRPSSFAHGSANGPRSKDGRQGNMGRGRSSGQSTPTSRRDDLQYDFADLFAKQKRR